MKIAVSADHGAFELKESVKKHLEEKGIEYHDFGCFSKESVDYPRYAYYAASAVARKEYDFGIILCTTGLGVSMAANKVKGIRAAVCTNEMLARMTRSHLISSRPAFLRSFTSSMASRRRTSFLQRLR